MLYFNFSLFLILFFSFFLYVKGRDLWFPAKILHHQSHNVFADNLGLKFSADSIFLAVKFQVFSSFLLAECGVIM